MEPLSIIATTLLAIGLIEEKYEEVSVIYRVLCNENPVYLPEFASLIYDFGNLLVGENENLKAERIFKYVINIRENLARQNPKDYQIILSQTLIHVALFYLFKKPDERESLNLSLGAYINASPFINNHPEAKDLCQKAKEVWQFWGGDLIKYLEENQGNENNV